MALDAFEAQVGQLAGELSGISTVTPSHIARLSSYLEALRRLAKEIRQEAGKTPTDTTKRLACLSLLVEVDDLMVQANVLRAHRARIW